jgi:biopolymer transport protein ExbB
MQVELVKNIIDYSTIGILGFMSFLSIWFYIERLLFYKNIDLDNYKHKQTLDIDLTKHITIISSIASNSVYIGLLGTVFGIIITFYMMGQTGQIDVKTIMSSLALALKATAMGLIVAIPSMFFYNHITRKIEVLYNLWEIKDEA